LSRPVVHDGTTRSEVAEPEEWMDRDALLDNARALLPAIGERVAEAESTRRIPVETIKELHEAGLFRVIQPKVWGGFELEPQVFLELGMLIATACGSTGWVYSILCVHSWELGCMSRAAQEEVWSEDPTTLTSSSYAPTGVVERVDGGYLLSGRWQFSSGCDHASWALLGALVPSDDGPRLSALLVPRSEYRIEDVWHVVGLQGTGSNDIVVEGAFVPDHRVHALTSGSVVSESPLYRIPFATLFGYSLTAPVIGMAQGALEAHLAWTRARSRKVAGTKVAEEVFSQIRVAEASNEIDAARLQMLNTFGEMLTLVAEGGEVPLALRARGRRDQVLGTQLALRAIDRVFANSGAHAIRNDSPIQRFWRDAHAASLHNSNVPEPILSAYGALQFGLESGGVPF
jgi:3-hydroxy-9,10-secoandrosta-1,3,5(10)-triene-9,17-dione monooxygenase